MFSLGQDQSRVWPTGHLNRLGRLAYARAPSGPCTPVARLKHHDVRTQTGLTDNQKPIVVSPHVNQVDVEQID